MRHQPEELGFNAPRENIEAPRSTTFMPAEFGAQIAVHREARQNLAEIPKAAAGIVLAHNEYKQSEKMGDIKIDMVNEEINQKEMKARFELYENNRIQDMTMQFLSDYHQRQEEAKANKWSLTETAQEVFDEYANPEDFAGSAYAQQQWQHTMRSYQLDLLPKAMNSDVEREYALMGFNLDQALGQAAGMVGNGSSLEDAFGQFTQRLANYKNIDANKLEALRQKSWNKLIESSLLHIANRAVTEGWSVDKVNETLAAFRDTYTTNTFNWTDTDGKELTENGAPITFTVSMSAENQDKIQQYINSLTSKAAHANNGGVAMSAENFEKMIDWKQFKDEGYCNWLRNQDLPSISSTMSNRIAEINAGSGSEATKNQKRLDVVGRCAPMYLTKGIADAIDAGQMEMSDVTQLLANLGRDINQAGYKGDWLEYNCPVKVGNKTLTIGLPEEIKKHIPDSAHAMLYWKDTLGYLNKFASTGRKSADFLQATNSTYSGAQDAAFTPFISPDGLQAEFCEKTASGYRAKASDAFNAGLQGMSNASDDANAGQAGLSTGMTNGMIHTIQQIDDPRARFATAVGVGQSLKTYGYAGDLLIKLGQHNGSKTSNDINDASVLLQAGCFLSLEDQQLVDMALQKGANLPDIAKIYKQGSMNDSNTNSAVVEVLNAMNVQPEFFPVLFYVGEVLGVGISANATKADAQTYKSTIQKKMKSIIENNFHTFSPGAKMKHAVYKYSRQMYNQDLPKLDKTLSSTIKEMETYFGREGRDFSFMSNPNTGDFDICFGDRAIVGTTYSGQQVPVASIMTEYTKNGSTVQPDALAKYIGLQAFVGLVATDPITANTAVQHGRIPHGFRTIVAGRTQLDTIKNAPMNVALYNLAQMHLALKSYLDKRHASAEHAPSIQELRQKAMMYSNIMARKDIMDIYLNNHYDNAGVYVSPTAFASPTMLGMQGVAIESAKNFATKEDLKYAPETMKRLMHPGHQVELASWLEQFITSAEKTSQGRASLPLSTDALGEEYFDKQNATRTAGYEITGVQSTGIADSRPVELEDAGEDEGAPTGFAVNLGNGVTQYSKDEIKAKAYKVAGKYQIPRELMDALIVQESGYKVDAKSKAGASGLMQLMPETAKSMGVTDIYNVDQNIDGGAKYLQLQFKRFGSWPLALAAYNAGPAAVEDYLYGTNKTGQNPKHRKTGGIPNFPETQNYVKNIMAKSGLNNKTYGIELGLASNRNRFMDEDTGMLSVRGMQSFVNFINNTATYGKNVHSITTNRKELLENKPEHADFAPFRKLKNSAGKPLFVAGDVDGFRINVNKTGTNKIQPAAVTALAEDVVNNQSDAFAPVSHDTARTLLRIFGDRYDLDGEKYDKFGLANLSVEEYNKYGVPLNALDNPVFQARTLIHEFQRAKDVLGTDRKAVFALAGGELKTEAGEVKSWQDIKADEEAYAKEWYISPSSDATKRNAINEVLAMFNKFHEYAAKEV